jgi:energy-coupling factor transporter transmembrane protein EcfT
VWGLYGLQGLESLAEIAAVALAVALAVIPRRPDVVGLAAACAAVIIAAQLGIEHWFYLYIPWFFGLVILALFGALTDPSGQPPAAASAPARSSQPAAALSS